MRTFNKNRRNYRKKVGRLTEEDDGMQEDDEMQKGSDEEEFSDSNDEGTSSAGKRTKAVQGGTKKKARMDR
jgi:hypothetical protein